MKSIRLLGTVVLASSLFTPFALSKSEDLKGLMHVSDEMLSAQHTASDLIGTAVYDKLGQKVGEITDIGLAKNFAENLQKGWTKVEEEREMVPRKDIGVDVVFIQVGGVMGMGGSIVSAPTSLLNYNSENDRIEIEYLKESIVAFAEGGQDDLVTSAKQEFYTAAEKVEEALENNSMLKGLREKIDVSVEDGKLVLRGELADQKMIDAVGDLAKKHTNLDIHNYITVAN